MKREMTVVLDGFVLDRRPNRHERQAPRLLDQGLLRLSFGLRNHPAGGSMSTGGGAVIFFALPRPAKFCDASLLCGLSRVCPAPPHSPHDPGDGLIRPSESAICTTHIPISRQAGTPSNQYAKRASGEAPAYLLLEPIKRSRLLLPGQQTCASCRPQCWKYPSSAQHPLHDHKKRTSALHRPYLRPS